MKDFLRRRVLHNFGIKLLSLVLAVGLWLAVTRDPVAEAQDPRRVLDDSGGLVVSGQDHGDPGRERVREQLA